MESNQIKLLADAKSLMLLAKKRSYRFLMVSVALSHLTACNVVGGKQPDPIVQPSSMRLTSTDGTQKQPAILDPAEKGGQFTIFWLDVRNNNAEHMFDAYDADVYLSENATIDSADVKFYHTFSAPLEANAPGSVSDHTLYCTYGSDNTIACAINKNTSPKIDIQPLLNTLPKSANIIVQDCLRTTGRCATASMPVTLQ